MKCSILSVALFACLSFSAIKGVHSQEYQVKKQEDLNFYLNSENDSLYVLNFWATWCKPCIEEMPYFESLQKNYADRKVKVVFISLDFAQKAESTVKPFIRKRKLISEVIVLDDYNPNDLINAIDPSWTGAIPATLIIKGSEGFRDFHERSFTYDELKSLIQPKL